MESFRRDPSNDMVVHKNIFKNNQALPLFYLL